MKDEGDPISSDEVVIRLIWTDFYRPGMSPTVQESAFKPRADETDGISVFRAACLGTPEDALAVMAEDKHGRYAIAALPVSEILALGLSVQPARIDAVPGHAVLPELTITAFQADRAGCRALQQQLAEIASRNLLRGPGG